MGLDYGARRMGVALSDPDGVFATPLEPIVKKRSGRAEFVRRVCALVREHEVERIVLGLPLHMDGRRGPEAEAVEAFGAELEASASVPVAYVDERWTTAEADRALRDMGARGRKKKARLDSTAAALILRTYLERERVSC